MKKGQRTRRKIKELAQLRKLRHIIDQHKWSGMMTLKMPNSFMIRDEEKLVRKICHMFADRFRSDSLKNGFLIKREFGTGENRSLHYHVIFKADIPKQSLERIKKAWLRILGVPDNTARYFDWRAPHDGEYLKKTNKRWQSVVVIPRSYERSKLSKKMFHIRGLGRKAGLIEDIEPVDQQTKTMLSQSQLPASDSCLTQSIMTPTGDLIENWRQKLPNRSISEKANFRGGIASRRDFSRTKFTQNWLSASVEIFTQNESQKICETCEYHGIRSVLRHDEEICPACGERWDMCCPF